MTLLSRQTVSEAVDAAGWRLLLGQVKTGVRVGSLGDAAEVAAALAAAVGDLGAHLDVRLAADRVELSIGTPGTVRPTAPDLDLAGRLSAVVAGLGRTCEPGLGEERVTQTLELAVDALDIPAVRPFWAAVLGYVDELPDGDPAGGLVDPRGQGPSVWFQQMDAERPQRNRLHLDISVPHDERAARVDAALAAGGVLLSDAAAPAFWILADVEGNEVCVCTWQGRDAQEEKVSR